MEKFKHSPEKRQNYIELSEAIRHEAADAIKNGHIERDGSIFTVPSSTHDVSISISTDKTALLSLEIIEYNDQIYYIGIAR